MMFDNFKLYVFVYLIILIMALAVSLKFREKFWKIFCSVFPLILLCHILFNFITFRSINQNHIHPAYQGHLERLPSNELIDLFVTSTSPSRASWIYLLVEDYYQGQTLWIPESIIDSLDLSPERLHSQGRLADVKILDIENELSEDEIDKILSMEYAEIYTKEGVTYHFIREERDSKSPLLILQQDDRLFFFPQGLLQEKNEGEK